MKTEPPLAKLPWVQLLSLYRTNQFALFEYERMEKTFNTPGAVITDKQFGKIKYMQRIGIKSVLSERAPIIAEMKRRMRLVGARG